MCRTLSQSYRFHILESTYTVANVYSNHLLVKTNRENQRVVAVAVAFQFVCSCVMGVSEYGTQLAK